MPDIDLNQLKYQVKKKTEINKNEELKVPLLITDILTKKKIRTSINVTIQIN
jgi:hypothetical protein